MKLNERQGNLIKIAPKSLIERSSGSLIKRGLADFLAL